MQNDASPPRSSGRSADVVVVGAGTAGLVTATLVARRGLQVVVLDRSTRPPADLAVRPLARAGVMLLTRWGLLDRVTTVGTPPITRATYRYADETKTITVKPALGVDALYAPRRALLHAAFRAAAVEAGVEIRTNMGVADVIVRGRRVIGVRAVTAGQRTVDVRGALVIGADGVRSIVADRVQSPFLRLGRHPSASTCAFWSDLDVDGFEWSFAPEGRAAVLPTTGGLARVVATASPERIGGGGAATIRAVAAAGAPFLRDVLARGRIAGPARTTVRQRGFVRRAHGPGWALVGSAAFAKDPTSAHGFTDPLRDADLLAAAVTSGMGRSERLDGALAAYEETRNRVGIPIFDAVEELAAERLPPADVAQSLHRLSSAMVDEFEALSAW